MTGNRQILIDSLPEGKLEAINYKLIDNPIPAVGDEEILCKTLMVTIAAGSRAGLQGSASYAGAPKTNIVMNGTGVSRVEESNSDAFTVGDLVVCPSGWQDYSVQKASHCQKITEDIDLGHYLGALGTNGLTAYFGLLTVGQPLENDTVLVSAAAGSVGHLVGQIAKIKGARTVGVTSTAEKCRVLETKLGYESSVSYRSEDFRAELKAACPKGVDVFFDNVGGEILESALNHINMKARVVLCGGISAYNATEPVPGPVNLMNLVIMRARMEGFIVIDYMDRAGVAVQELLGWVESEKLKFQIDLQEGFENIPDTLNRLFTGKNLGKQLLKIDDPV